MFPVHEFPQGIRRRAALVCVSLGCGDSVFVRGATKTGIRTPVRTAAKIVGGQFRTEASRDGEGKRGVIVKRVA